VDIRNYAGNELNLVTSETASADDALYIAKIEKTLSGVCALIENLPPGTYEMGLVRPSKAPGESRQRRTPCGPESMALLQRLAMLA
jgi:hypothetical protein